MKIRIWRIFVSSIIFVIGIILKPQPEIIKLALFGLSYIIIGWDILWRAFKNILHWQAFDENFLGGIASSGAFFIGEYPEGVAVMLFYQIGELFQDYAVDKSRRSIAEVMDIRPEYANVKKGNRLVRTNPDEVKIGDIIVVKAGEKVPLDGKVIEGTTMVDTSNLTGESVPRDIEAGDEILSGCININGTITIEVTKEFSESTVSKILDMIENASSKKSESEKFITRFARYYTPVVVIVAGMLAVIPPFIYGWSTFNTWVYRSLSFLVVSCPCALVVSVPLSFFGGIGAASRQGILIKGSNYLEALAKTEIVVMDKTGTLTKGVFEVQEIHTKDNISKKKLLELAALAESYSNHPISLSLRRAYGKDIEYSRIKEAIEYPGHGVSAMVDGRKVLAGNNKLMKKMNIDYSDDEVVGTIVHVAVDNVYFGYIIIADEIKDDAVRAIETLKKSVNHIVMLTGDVKSIAEKTGNDLGIDKVHAQLLPADKVNKVEELLRVKSTKGKLAFVGDGINDAPVLARSDVGIAMGGLGSDAAIEAADIVIMNDEPSKISTAMKISKKTLRIANQNIFFAISVKIGVLLLSSAGLASMWAAVFADVGVTILVIINSFRALKK
ncbi:MAG: cadmium-translocating P-type ATPase [Clostridiaceae bacterium]|nr:cadmium-translocating P-type ATPase [Clostridiaceae bacterium]